jgi:hypothetical protein
MAIRDEVQVLVDAGEFPTENASVEQIAETERLLEQIAAPLSDEEAHALATIFGPDNCYGLSWTLLHLIETAPSALTARYTVNPDNVWVTLLNTRVAAGAREGSSARE